MSRLSKIFENNKKCFMPFVTAGHPDLEKTVEIVLGLASAGAHIVEIGIPFSDPIADGPIIQESSYQALQHGYSFSDYLQLVHRIRRQSDIGMIFMSYLNPILSYGLKKLDQEGHKVGLDGILISDLTPEEYSRMHPLEFLDSVFVVAPTSSDQRLKSISEVSQGFIYLVARAGVTGTHSDVDALVPETVARIRQYSDLPIAVGFGIKSAEDVRKVWNHAEGAVVGSAIVEFIEEHQSDSNLIGKVEKFVKKNLILKI